ncbi:hypothetical protein GGF40_000037 [Coemansia sp. RSA 1286]|nr:hypothetical protein GGF40_000037 [Coemansia sp. RSA 1286]
MSNSSNSSNDNSSDSSMYLLATLGEYRYYLNEFEEAKKRLDAFVSENRELRRYFTHISGTRVTDNNASTECLPQRPQNFIHTLYSILNDNANSDCICWFTTANGKSAFTVKSWNKLIKLFNLAGFKVGQELSIRKNLADYRFEKLNDRRKRVLVEEYDDDFVSNDSDSDNTKELLASTTGDSFCHKHFKPKRARLWLVVRRGPQKRRYQKTGIFYTLSLFCFEPLEIVFLDSL